MVRPLGLFLDPSAVEPLYKQIFDQVVSRIRSQAFPPGYRLPPTRILARDLATHRNTVVRAYADLEAAGFVTSTVGRGTFVAMTRPARPMPVPSAPQPASMPWASIVSRAAAAEPLSRAPRLSRAAERKDVINLTRMQPSSDLLPADLLRRCLDHVLRREGGRALSYAPPEGVGRLRALIAADLANQGVPAKAEDVLVTTGSQQALDVIARALINPGDAFLVDTTTYAGAINLLTVAGARLVPVPSDAEGPDPVALARLARSGAKGLYLMPNSHNPTGACVSAERRRALVAFSHDAGVPLIEDDYGADLVLEDAPPPPSLRALDGDVIYMGTFSKRLLPALRVGFILCPAGLRGTLAALKHAMDLGTSALLQHALAEFLDRGYLRAHLNRTLPEYRARRDALHDALALSLPPGMVPARPQRGVVSWLPLPSSLDPEVVYDEARRRGVLVTPSTLHTVDRAAPAGVRLTFCAEPTTRLAEGGKRLGEAIRALLRSTTTKRGEALEAV